LNDALELEPNNFEALAVLGVVLTELGNYTEALSILQKSLGIHYNVEVFAMLGYVNALKGKKDKAYEIIRQIQSQSKYNREYPTYLSRIYLALGEKETAYEFLERAFEQHDLDLIGLNSDPRWAKIRNESRFKELVLRVGLPID
jgi:adenylate cyclase